MVFVHSGWYSPMFIITFPNVSIGTDAVLHLIALFKLGRLCYLLTYVFNFGYFHRKKSQRVRSGEWGGHGMSSFQEIRRITFSGVTTARPHVGVFGATLPCSPKSLVHFKIDRRWETSVHGRRPLLHKKISMANMQC